MPFFMPQRASSMVCPLKGLMAARVGLNLWGLALTSVGKPIFRGSFKTCCLKDWLCLMMFLNLGVSYFGALCDVGKELCSFADATCLAVAISAWRCCCCILVCQVPLDSFLVLSFWWGLIVKLLLHGVLIDCLVALDAVELGWLFFKSLGGLICIAPFQF